MIYVILMLVAALFVALIASITLLNKRIDMLDDAMFQYMKEEHNSKMDTDCSWK